MPNDWLNLIGEFVRLLQDAQDYLRQRETTTTDAQERSKTRGLVNTVAEWRSQAELTRNMYASEQFSSSVSARDRRTYTFLSDDLKSASNKVRELHEWFDLKTVEKVFRELDRFRVRLESVGPHGPGKGKPGDP